MAKYQTVIDMYKRKAKDRKQRGADVGGFLRAGIGIIGVLIYVGIALATVTVVVLFAAIGMFVALIVGIIGIVIFIIRDRRKSKKKISDQEISVLREHLTRIDKNKEIANTSRRVSDVKNALDELIESIDFIMQYDEKFLQEIGMSKAKLPEQKEFILQNYDAILKDVMSN